MSAIELPIERDPRPIDKIAIARRILDRRNTEYNPQKRLLSLVALAMEPVENIDSDDPLLRLHLLPLMPGQPGMTQLDAWLKHKTPDITRIAHEDPRDQLTDAFYVYRETRKFDKSLWLEEARKLNIQFVNSRDTLEAEVAIRIMYQEAEIGTRDRDNRPILNDSRMALAISSVGLVAVHPHLGPHQNN